MTVGKTTLSSTLVVGLLFGLQAVRAEPAASAHNGGGSATGLQIPKVMEIEHEELHAELAKLTQAGGQTGDAAKAVAAVLDPHFANENSYALPPLGLLVPLAEGKFDCSMTEVLKMTDKLGAAMPTMLAEHKEITAALGKLSAAAKAENKPDGVQFAEALMAHAEGEEEITYPTALLIGRYVKDKAAGCPH
jgi:hypothetical protein